MLESILNDLHIYSMEEFQERASEVIIEAAYRMSPIQPKPKKQGFVRNIKDLTGVWNDDSECNYSKDN